MTRRTTCANMVGVDARKSGVSVRWVRGPVTSARSTPCNGTMLWRWALFLFWLAALAPQAGWCDEGSEVKSNASAVGQSQFRDRIQPLMKKYCFRCHSGPEPKSDVRLDKLSPDFVAGPTTDLEAWHDALENLNRGDMPPEEAEQPTAQERQALVDWITRELERAVAIRRSTGGRVVMRRLTRYEYNNTMRDLLGLDLNFAQNLPPEPSSKDGFQNNGAALGISPLQMEYYLQAAREALGQVIVTGPQPKVIKHHATTSENARRVSLKGSNELTPNQRKSQFIVRLKEFPREGEVLVSVRASAIVPQDAGYPRLRVTMGVRADVKAAEKVLGEADVTDGRSQTIEFRGRVEDFPQPGRNPKYPGLVITLYNVYDDGEPSASRKKQKGKDDPQSLEPRIVIESVDFEGPVLGTWPPPSHRRIFFDPSSDVGERSYAHEIIRRFLNRAYRQPVDDADVDVLMALFDRIRPHATSLEDAMRDVLAMALISPKFLYLVEPHQETDKKSPLTDYELASRLSYFLWSSMPDDRLFQLAAEGKLRQRAVLEAEVERMIDDSKSRQFVERFSSQWLDLAAIDRVAVNPEYYPDFDDRLKTDMCRQTQAFFAEILYHDLSCLNLLDSDFTMLNRRLSKHYGIDGPRGDDFQRVRLPADSHRGGLLTHGSFLLANSNGEDSHPIRRAVWLLDRILDSPPAPPPPDVPDLDPNEPSLAGLPLKKQLELHRQKTACNNCHQGIDPWGVAFENYDAIGRWRTEVAGPNRKSRSVVDAEAQLPDGTRINGVDELKQYLIAQRQQQFARAFVKRVLTYAIGRSLELTDQQSVDSLTETFVQSGYRLSALLKLIAQDQAFQTK